MKPILKVIKGGGTNFVLLGRELVARKRRSALRLIQGGKGG